MYDCTLAYLSIPLMYKLIVNVHAAQMEQSPQAGRSKFDSISFIVQLPHLRRHRVLRSFLAAKEHIH